MHEAAVSPSPDLTPELQVVRHLVATRLERSIDEVIPTQRLMSDLRLGCSASRCSRSKSKT